MRVIAGEFRSRQLKSPPGLDTRPTPDRLRESLFNILAPSIQGAIFADLHAGCGAVGIEALSRGAARAIFIERAHRVAGVLRENLQTLGLTSRADVIQGGVAAQLPRLHADIVFTDPPYQMLDEYDAVLRHFGERAATEGASPLVIIQHATRVPMPVRVGGLEKFRQVRQGDNSLSFYHFAPEAPAPDGDAPDDLPPK